MDKYEDVFSRLYQDISKDLVNKNLDRIIDDFEVVELEDVNSVYYSDYVIVDYVEEDKLDEKVDKLGFNLMRDGVLAFNTEIYLEQILSSYHSPKEICEQFCLDCPRCEILLEGETIKSLIELQRGLTKFSEYELSLRGRTYDLPLILTMLCNQSSYAFPYVLTHKLLADIEKNIFVASLSTNRFVKIRSYERKIDIDISADFGLKNLYQKNLLSTVSIRLKLSVNLDANNLFSKNSLFVWDKK